jgi:hypothetical protein
VVVQQRMSYLQRDIAKASKTCQRTGIEYIFAITKELLMSKGWNY